MNNLINNSNPEEMIKVSKKIALYADNLRKDIQIYSKKGTAKKPAHSPLFLVYPFISLTFFVKAGHITFRSATIP